MKNIYDIIEIWCPQVREFIPQDYSNDEREVWMYTCGWKFPPFPCYSIPVPGIAARITGWMCRKYNVTGFLFLGSNVWETGQGINIMRGKAPGEKRWVKDGWRPPFGTGDGILYYPAREGPVPSHRLICIRDGTEDYEYLTQLRGLLQAGNRAPASLRNEARKIAAVPPEIVSSTKNWTRDVEKIEATRVRAAELIVELSRYVKREKVE